MTIQDINKLENIEQLADDIYSYYKINDLIYLGKGEKKKKAFIWTYQQKLFMKFIVIADTKKSIVL